MRRNTRAEETRPTLCHAEQPRPAVRPAAQTGLATADGRSRRRLAPNVIGNAFEIRALGFLQRQGLRCVARNVRCRGGEIDLVMREPDETLVFVEVRARGQRRYGGAAASVGWRKRQRLLCAAQHFLVSYGHSLPVCRFDVVAFEGERPVWLRDAFRADGS